MTDRPEEPQPPKPPEEVLASLKLEMQTMHMDWTLPTCVGCKRHFRVEMLKFSNGPKSGKCAECLDDDLAINTGCRFGRPADCDPESHPDCYLAKE